MSGWFTTWTFWVGVFWGASVTFVALVHWLIEPMGELLGWSTTNDLRADLMSHCLSLDAQFHATHPPGELIERIDGDLDGLSLFFSQFLVNVVGMSAKSFAFTKQVGQEFEAEPGPMPVLPKTDAEEAVGKLMAGFYAKNK